MIVCRPQPMPGIGRPKRFRRDESDPNEADNPIQPHLDRTVSLIDHFTLA
jgi:hypothetical protein